MSTHYDAAPDLKETAVRTPAVLEPEFLRLSDCWNIYRLRRGQIYSLIRRGKIKSLSLRERGKQKGTRLISHESLRQFILSCEVVGSEATDQNSTK